MQASEIPIGSMKAGDGATDDGATERRLFGLDVMRSAAILGMVVFHFTRDLEIFGVLEPGTTVTGAWAVFARLVAGSFLFLSGVSLFLAHGRGLRWAKFSRRIGVVGLAALAVTAATYAAMPQSFVFFGILHAIVVANCVGLVFVRAPVALTLVVAASAFAAPHYLRSDIFNAPWALWIGLSTSVPRTLDYLPILPWLAPCLAGIATAQALRTSGRLEQYLRGARAPGRIGKLVAWPGRHSLAIYLVHQPILLGLLWLWANLPGA